MIQWKQIYSELVVILFCYSCGELGHYLLAVTSRSVAQDVEFGDKGCMAYNDTFEESYQTSCVELNNETICESTSNISSYCKWDYTGRGLQYQILAGPAYIVVFTVMGIVFGVLGDKYNRIRMLVYSVIFFSLMTFLTGFAQEYWHLLVLRFGFGAGESGCTPLASSIIAGKFTADVRARAIGIFNFGIYLGYGTSFAMGNALTDADLFGTGWRACYVITGILGIIFAVMLWFVGKELPRHLEIKDQETDEVHCKRRSNTTFGEAWWTEEKGKTTKTMNKRFQKRTFGENMRDVLALSCCNITIPLFLIGACFRHSASFCWSYSAQNYFDTYYPGSRVGLFMALTSIIGGSFGIVIGGILSDILVRKYGVTKRIWVLAVSQAIAAPFAAGVLLIPPPQAFLMLLFAYFFAEMWYGVFLTIITEFYPANMRATAVAAVIFLINNIGGNAQLLVPPLSNLIGFREALLVLYPGFYMMSAVFFLLAGLSYVCCDREASIEPLEVDTKL